MHSSNIRKANDDTIRLNNIILKVHCNQCHVAEMRTNNVLPKLANGDKERKLIAIKTASTELVVLALGRWFNSNMIGRVYR